MKNSGFFVVRFYFSLVNVLWYYFSQTVLLQSRSLIQCYILLCLYFFFCINFSLIRIFLRCLGEGAVGPLLDLWEKNKCEKKFNRRWLTLESWNSDPISWSVSSPINALWWFLSESPSDSPKSNLQHTVTVRGKRHYFSRPVFGQYFRRRRSQKGLNPSSYILLHLQL